MPFRIHWNSLKTRVTLLTLAIFLVSLWSMLWYAGQMLRRDLIDLLSEQQLTTVSLVASEIDQALALRLRSLDRPAGLISPDILGNRAAMQTWLERQPILQELFNGGVVVLDAQGTAIAEAPLPAQRLDIGYADRDYFKAVMVQGKAIISEPLTDKRSRRPIIVVAVPIRGAAGPTLGVLAGVIDLEQPNFLDRITENRYGRTGETFLVTPQTRAIVATSDQSRLMEVLPAPGISPWIDRFMQGYEGSAIVVNPHGLEVLASVRQVPVAGWYTSVILSTQEAFAPIVVQRRRMLIATLLITLFSAALTWWMLRRQLAPLMQATRKITRLAASEQPPPLLPITRHDEVGALIGGFNGLLSTLAQRQRRLQESEGRFRALADNAPALVWMAGTDARRDYFNQVWFDLTGRTPAQEAGDGWEAGVHPDDRPRRQAIYASAFTARQAFRLDYRLRCRDGRYRWLTEHGVPRHDDQGRFLGYIGTCIDITERKGTEARLQLLASVFTHAREGILISTAKGTILDINDGFSRITGYTLDDVRGRNTRILKSGRHDSVFYADLWNALLTHGEWTGEIWNRRKNGEIYAALLTISAVCDDQGRVGHYVALSSDITALKEHERRLEQIAHFDTLTGLPNRALLIDRLHQALAQAQRRRERLAVVFLDLDGFKAVNDEYGHEAGDQVLIAAAGRMKQALREGDTLARLGGDEFIAVLLNLTDIDASVPLFDRLLAAAAEPVPFGDVRLQVSASLGATFYPQAGEVDADQLLRQADRAMYQAKLAGKNRYQVFDSDPDLNTVFSPA
jgi:diguanylate cyclase (GGDEF)-like protein/PAS domain S-box-containing protein